MADNTDAAPEKFPPAPVVEPTAFYEVVEGSRDATGAVLLGSGHPIEHIAHADEPPRPEAPKK